MQFYFVVTFHVVMMLWNTCHICPNVIILFFNLLIEGRLLYNIVLASDNFNFTWEIPVNTTQELASSGLCFAEVSRLNFQISIEFYTSCLPSL